MLAIRPPNECPPIAAPGSAGRARRGTRPPRARGSISAARAPAAPTPCAAQRLHPRSHRRGGPRGTVAEEEVRRAPAQPASHALLTFEHRKCGRLHDVRATATGSPRQPCRTDERAAEQDAAAAPEGQPDVDAVERSEHRGAERHPGELVQAADAHGTPAQRLGRAVADDREEARLEDHRRHGLDRADGQDHREQAGGTGRSPRRPRRPACRWSRACAGRLGPPAAHRRGRAGGSAARTGSPRAR